MGRVTACLLVLAAAQSAAQSRGAARAKFVVASIKARKDGSADKKGGGGGGTLSPGTLRLDCSTVMDLIHSAYVLFENGRVNPRSGVVVEGGPAWINSARYQIHAMADGAKGQGMMRGPMLQTLLEDRFQLQVHHESREVPAYAVTVAKGGLKARPFQEGSCVPRDFTRFFEQFPPQPFPDLPPGQKYCAYGMTEEKGTVTLEAVGMSIDDFLKSLPKLDRPVVNRTRIKGLFDLHLEFAPDEPTSAGASPAEVGGPSIFTAMERQLGLKPARAKAPGGFVVIDHVERPSANWRYVAGWANVADEAPAAVLVGKVP